MLRSLLPCYGWGAKDSIGNYLIQSVMEPRPPCRMVWYHARKMALLCPLLCTKSTNIHPLGCVRGCSCT